MSKTGRSPMAIIERCIQVIDNSPDGVTWERLNERIELLAKTSKREKSKVYMYLLQKSNIWNNQSQDMSSTIFMLKHLVASNDSDENSTTQVSSDAAVKKADRLKRFQSLGSKSPTPVSAPTPAPVKEPEIMQPNIQPQLVDKYVPTEEEDLLAEMAWHVQNADEHGLTITGLRMSVPEYSECDDHLRFQLITAMRERYNIALYTKTLAGGREIRVLMMRPGARQVHRPDKFVILGRQARRPGSHETGAINSVVSKFGQVKGNALADALSSVNASELFNRNAGSEFDEHDEDEDMDIDNDGPIPLSLITQPMAPTEPEPELVPLIIPKKASEQIQEEPIVNEVPEVGRETVIRTADALRLIAAQLEAQAVVSEEVIRKKSRFDHLMKEARDSADAVQFALNKHNGVLNQLQIAADELASI